MKRDADLIRAIVLAVEDCPDAELDNRQTLEIEGFSQAQINEHVRLAYEGGLIRASNVSNLDVGVRWNPTGLTNEGHDFLKLARDQGRWDRAKAIALEKTGSLGFSVITKVLTDMIAKAAS